jgi:crotonobetainyl-CoA:carnitine CoA-transferase CaiB-like acyl-CoA transferase
MSGGSLEGVRVLDLTSVVVGPLATQILADHGADVIKVESPSGDIGRTLAGRGRTEGMSGKFLHLNRNKRSVVLDLKSRDGLAALMRMVKTADVLLWNVRPDSMARMGLGYDAVRAVNPRIVYCGMFGFGQDGRYKDKPAYDSIIQGASGVAALHERVSGTPRYVPYVMADRTVGLIAVQMILMALFRREKSGRGQAIEIPMFENMVTQVMTEHMYLATFDPPLAGGGDAQNAYGDPRVLDPENRPIPTRDGYVCISANTDAQAFALFAAIGRPELKDDARFSSVGARFKNVGEYFAIRAKGLQQKTSAEWLDVFDRMDVPAAPYHTLETLQQDPHLRDAGFFQRVEHPTEGAIWNMRPANKLSGGARSDFRAAPKLGQHTREVLSEAGYSKDEIDALISSGAARAWKGTP